MVGIGIRQVQFKDMQLSVDGVEQSNVLSKFVKQGNAAESGAIDAVVEFEVKVTAAAKDRLGAVGQFGFVEALLDDSLACVEFLTETAMTFASGVLALTAVLPLASIRFLV